MNVRRLPWLVSALALVLWMPGCGDDDTAPAGPGFPQENEDATRVRALHLSPDAPAVDLFVDGSGPVVEDLSFGRTTSFVPLPSGAERITVVPAGGTLQDALFDMDVRFLDPRTDYTAVVFGPVSEIQTRFLAENLPRPVGQLALARIGHAASGIDTVDIIDLDGPGAPTLVTGLEFGGVASPLELPLREYRLAFDVGQDTTPDVVFPVRLMQAGMISNIFAAVDAKQQPFLLALSPEDVPPIRIDPEGVEPSETGAVRALHLSPDAPEVDIWVDGAKVVTGLAFTEGTGYLNLVAGPHDFAVVPADAPLSEAVISVDDVSIKAGESYTLAAIGRVTSIQPLLLEDDLSPVPGEQLRVRGAHTAPDVGTVDVWVGPTGGEFMPLYPDIAFGDVGAYQTFAVGAYTLGIDVDDDATPDLLFDLPNVEAGTIANGFVVNDDAGKVFLLVQLADGTVVRVNERSEPPATGQVRALHLSPDAPAVDIWVDGTKAVTGLAFREGTDYLELDAGPHDFAAVPAGGMLSDAVISVEGVEIMAGKSYTLAAIGRLASIEPLLLEDDLSPVEMERIRVRGIHAAPDVGVVDVWARMGEEDFAALYTDVAFGDVGAYKTIAAGMWILGIDVDDDMMPDLVFELPALEAGAIGNLFVTNDASGQVLVLAQLADGTIVCVKPTGEPPPPPPPGETAAVRFIHLSPNAPPVDVRVEGLEEPLVSGLAYSEATSYLTVPAGSATVLVVPAGAPPAEAVLTVPVELMADTSYTVAVYGLLANIGAALIEDELTGIPDGQLRVRLVHTADGLGTVSFFALPEGGSWTLLYDMIAYGEIGAALDIAAGTYQLGIDETGDGFVDYAASLPSLSAGQYVMLFPVVKEDGSRWLILLFEDGSTLVIEDPPV